VPRTTIVGGLNYVARKRQNTVSLAADKTTSSSEGLDGSPPK
jgi:hypothetical protein